MKRIEITGLTYGRLLILAEHGKWAEVRCHCGIEKKILRSNILAGYSTSCGCYQKQQTSEANIKHGQRLNDKQQTGAYRSWKAMKNRCNNPFRESADRYLHRGITYDPYWEEFENFYRDMGDRPVGKELDRINNNDSYYKENCRWTTHQQNCKNRGY